MQSKLSCYQHKIVYYNYNMFYMSFILTKTLKSDVEAQNFKWEEKTHNTGANPFSISVDSKRSYKIIGGQNKNICSNSAQIMNYFTCKLIQVTNKEADCLSNQKERKSRFHHCCTFEITCPHPQTHIRHCCFRKS